MWKRAAFYGAALAAGRFALQWLDYQRPARAHSGEVYVFLVAVAFLALGIFLGARLFGATRPARFEGNPKAQASLGISPREFAVLRQLAARRSNKEIAAELDVSPNTVKTHVARLFEKLGSTRRTEAINRARELESCLERRRFGVIRAKSPVWRMAPGPPGVANGGTIGWVGRASMLRRIVYYGLIAGLLVGVPLSIMTVGMNGHPPLRHGMVIGYTMMLVALSTVFVAIKRHRDRDLGGVIRFWPALGLAVGISVVAGICYVIAWESAVAIAHMDFASSYSAQVIAEQRAKGVSGEALAKVIADMERFKVQYADPLFRLPMVFAEIFPVGLLVSLVSAGLLRNSRFLPARPVAGSAGGGA